MKTGQLTLFTDIINEAVKDDLESKGQVLPEDHWINQPLKSENDKTLLLAAIEEVRLLKSTRGKSLLESWVTTFVHN